MGSRRGGFAMREIGIAAITLSITALIVLAGVSGKKIWFIDGPRAAAIVLGIVGMLFCTISVGKFVTAAPAHPLSILGYLFGVVALLAFLTQIFRWHLPFIGDPKTALYVMAACILVKTVIGRFAAWIG